MKPHTHTHNVGWSRYSSHPYNTASCLYHRPSSNWANPGLEMRCWILAVVSLALKNQWFGHLLNEWPWFGWFGYRGGARLLSSGPSSFWASFYAVWRSSGCLGRQGRPCNDPAPPPNWTSHLHSHHQSPLTKSKIWSFTRHFFRCWDWAPNAVSFPFYRSTCVRERKRRSQEWPSKYTPPPS